MAKSQRRTVGQQLGLLTGLGLILGGVLGWAWSLFQAPGRATAPPVEVPTPPELSTTGPVHETAGLEVLVEPGDRAVIEREPLDGGLVEPVVDLAPADPESSELADPVDFGPADPESSELADPVDFGPADAESSELADPVDFGPDVENGPEVDDVGSPDALPDVTASEEPPVAAPSTAPTRSVPADVPDAVKAIRAAAAAARERLDAPTKALPTNPDSGSENAPEVG